jgi:vacuolar-type H+-ATPase subunit E/Vma4
VEQEKLAETLLETIKAQSQERLANLQADYESQRREIIERYRQEATEEANVYIDMALSELKNSVVQNESQSKWKLKKDLFIKRAELVDGLFEQVKGDLMAFTQTEAYGTYLREKLAKLLPDHPLQDTLILIKPSDKVLFETILPPLARLVLSENIHVGGFILKSADGIKERDETLDYALKVQREWFTTHSTLDF